MAVSGPSRDHAMRLALANLKRQALEAGGGASAARLSHIYGEGIMGVKQDMRISVLFRNRAKVLGYSGPACGIWACTRCAPFQAAVATAAEEEGGGGGAWECLVAPVLFVFARPFSPHSAPDFSSESGDDLP